MTNPAIGTLDETVLPAEALPLPPQRRLMIFFLLALTVVLHVATSGWGPIQDGAEGWNAAVGRELAVGVEADSIGKNWDENVIIAPAARVMALSFQVFGISEQAARLPFALANLLVVWLVFLTAERQGGMWRGLSSGTIAATSVGAVLLARDGGGAALVAAVFMVALHAAMRMLEQQSRIRWQCLFWAILLLMLGLREPLSGLLLVIALLGAGVCYRVARYRLRWVWWGAGAALYATAVVYGWSQGWWMAGAAVDTGAWWQVWVVLFPWSAVILPALFLQLRRVLRWEECNPQEVVLWTVAILFFIWAAVAGPVQNWTPGMACFWPLAALLGGLIWDRATSGMRIIGVALVALLAGAAIFFGTQWIGETWIALLRPIWWMSCSVVAVFGVFAAVSVKLRHSRAALLTLAASAIPLAFNLIDARSRHTWAVANQVLASGPERGFVPGSRVHSEVSIREIGTFLFYAPRGLQVLPLNGKPWPTLEAENYILALRSGTSVEPPWKVVASSPTLILIESERR